ncbi:gene transfer agent family protein [Blastomonas sp. AAP53]|uniref:gene transfer agent family protein n=1 Tax=Blastomonas sp. AAP53 TaxID=1248760 RepID=UPI0002FB9C9F|nr:gene transfer agent family protein [Blastomonas sp. AAP53]
MSGGPSANPVRGEALLQLGGHDIVLRPAFAALVAAEQEIGPLFDLVERAAAGRLGLAELVALLWHCRVEESCPLDRGSFAEALAQAGLVALTPALKTLLRQILQGR